MLCSVLIHLLPGLALFAHRHCTVPEPWMHAWQYVTSAAAPASDVPADNPVSFFWISGAPLLFYAAWQLMYFFIVQASPVALKATSPPGSCLVFGQYRTCVTFHGVGMHRCAAGASSSAMGMTPATMPWPGALACAVLPHGMVITLSALLCIFPAHSVPLLCPGVQQRTIMCGTGL